MLSKFQIISIIIFILGTSFPLGISAQKMDDWLSIHQFSNGYQFHIVDSIPASDQLDIISDSKTGHWYILKNKSVKFKNIKNSLPSGVYLFLPDFIERMTGFIAGVGSLYFYSLLKDWTQPLKYLHYDDQYQGQKAVSQYVYYPKRPDFYLLILIQGITYNELIMEYSSEGNPQKKRFKDPYAYYPLLTPIFK